MTITTTVQFTRVKTQAEVDALHARLADCIAEGTTTGEFTFDVGPTYSSKFTRIWTTVDAANNWVALVNSFTPPPDIAFVTNA